jgi:hypothetical protein
MGYCRRLREATYQNKTEHNCQQTFGLCSWRERKMNGESGESDYLDHSQREAEFRSVQNYGQSIHPQPGHDKSACRNVGIGDFPVSEKAVYQDLGFFE